MRGLPTGGYATTGSEIPIGRFLETVRFDDVNRDGQADLVVAQPGDF